MDVQDSAEIADRDAPIAILGYGVEGQAVVDYLQERGFTDLTVCDKEERLTLPSGVKPRLGDDYLAGLDSFRVIFRSPGVPRDLASIADAERAGAIVTSATKEFFRRCPCTIVGITGSNGKTTTTALIAELLRHLYGDNLHVGGNDREPLLGNLKRIERDHVAVLELSSFQLQDLTQSPHVALVLNISPNHLDVHVTLEEYVLAKSQIVRHQSPADHAVLNWSFTRVRELAHLMPSQVVYFNHAEATEGAFVRDGMVILRQERSEEILASVAEVPVHTNIDNFLAASCVAQMFGVPAALIRRTVLAFQGVRHRVELVGELDGVRYYDDSASTTPESSINALRSFAEGKVVLIAGGSDKRLSYDMLAQEIVRTRTRTVLIGQTRDVIAEAVRETSTRLRHDTHVSLADTLSDAIQAARALAGPGDAVVLSPACASFDMFRNAKDRGDQFRALVAALR